MKLFACFLPKIIKSIHIRTSKLEQSKDGTFLRHSRGVSHVCDDVNQCFEIFGNIPGTYARRARCVCRARRRSWWCLGTDDSSTSSRMSRRRHSRGCVGRAAARTQHPCRRIFLRTWSWSRRARRPSRARPRSRPYRTPTHVAGTVDND